MIVKMKVFMCEYPSAQPILSCLSADERVLLTLTEH